MKTLKDPGFTTHLGNKIENPGKLGMENFTRTQGQVMFQFNLLKNPIKEWVKLENYMFE